MPNRTLTLDLSDERVEILGTSDETTQAGTDFDPDLREDLGPFLPGHKGKVDSME
jgi:hypothetical protein